MEWNVYHERQTNMDSNYSLNAYFCDSLLIRGAPFDAQWGGGMEDGVGYFFFFLPLWRQSFVLFCFFFTPQMDRFCFFQSHWWVKILFKNFHFATGFWGQVGLFFFFFFCCSWQQIVFFFFKKIPCPPAISTGAPLMFSNT